MAVERSHTSEGEKEGLFSVGANTLYSLVTGPARTGSEPIVVCFHGSGGGSESWSEFIRQVSSQTRVLLYHRSGHGQSKGRPVQTPSEAVADLDLLLEEMQVTAPFVLVAHSYGGRIAREFLQHRSRDVVGMVLVETGQETIAPFEEEQYRRQMMGDKPLAVIRGNSLIHKWAEYDRKVELGQSSAGELELERHMLDLWDAEDSRLKREQLRLSRKTQWIEVKQCGHDVIRDSPMTVAQALQWVIHNVGSTAPPQKVSISTQRMGCRIF